jgi:hypothetical protein
MLMMSASERDTIRRGRSLSLALAIGLINHPGTKFPSFNCAIGIYAEFEKNVALPLKLVEKRNV